MSQMPKVVPFSFFCSLLREISLAPSHKPSADHRYNNPNYPALNIFRRWTCKLRKDYSPLPPGTTATVFKLLFPNEDHHRRFDMQETRLSRYVADCFGINEHFLDQWLLNNAFGCLGEELKSVLSRTCPSDDGHVSPLSLAEVDELLDELASSSAFTDATIRRKHPRPQRRSPFLVIKALFRTLSPTDAGFLTQIILKDLRPTLYPLRETHYIAALLNFSTTSVKMLSKENAMNVWDPSKWMLNAYRVRATLTETADVFELSHTRRGLNVPRIGVPVAVPKSEKGRSPRHALQFFRHCHQVWAETKYDGERAQIHVDILTSGTKITIFSKSKRDSTWDRKAVHETVYATLGLTKHGMVTSSSKVKINVILDAEMVVFHGREIDEFWRIKGLVEQTATSIRGKHKKSEPNCDQYSQSSMLTDDFDGRRLGLVFFDILVHDSKSLVMTSYGHRRRLLEDLIQVIPGECTLAERVPVGLKDISYDDHQQIEALEKIFSNAIAMHQEGLILKGEETRYHDFSVPWVKLKKDYIPEYGDTIDMVIVGVGWEKDRGRILRVPPSTITTFYIGGLENPEEVKHQPPQSAHFHVYFTVSYGPTRRELEEINFRLQNSETIPYSPTMDPGDLDYTFTLLQGLPPPMAILKRPLLAEIFGAGFTKTPNSRHYELRFPRLSKIYRHSDRSWQDGVDLKELHKIACEVIGRDCSSKVAKDISAGIWGLVPSPGVKSSTKRKATSGMWEDRFAVLDGRTKRKANPNPPTISSGIGWEDVHRSNQKPLPLSQKSVTKADKSVIPSSTSSQCDTPPRPLTPVCVSTRYCIPTITSETNALTSPHADRNIAKPEPRTTPPGMAFLRGALVWFAKHRGSSTPNWPLRTWVPRFQQLHSVESLLIGCGWCTDASGWSSWADKGIIFVDEHCPVGKELACHALRIINERGQALPADHPRKPIWVFDHRKWEFDEDDIERGLLHRLA